jgi:nucleoside-diphosphate-sugar epimerase
VARCLIIGCGCRGQSLAGNLRDRGYTVRGTTRDRLRAHELQAAGVEPVVGDPARVATLAQSLEQVTVVCVLLGSAVAAPQGLAALHGARLEMLLARMVDTTVRGIVYETSGAVGGEILRAGGRRVRAFCEESRIRYALIAEHPRDHHAWLKAAVGAVERVLTPR